ncbi:MAG: hypothetical protein FWJ65_06690 [Limnochordales bacterium]
MISTEFLSKLATYANQEIAKVRLNGTYEITQFEVKRVDGGVVTLNYLVPAAEVSQINQIDLVAADGTVISSNAVDVPITADTLMVQTLSFEEVS